MANIKRFEDLAIWQLAKEVANLIYDITQTGPFSRDFVLKDQARRASVSIFSNIAEGFERDGNKEFIQFLSISKGSCGELRAQVRFAFDRDYISEEQLGLLIDKLLRLSGQISNFTNYLRNNEMRGRKYS
jgi:four helix bundle protein